MTALLTPPAVDNATRREFLALLAAAGLITGCSTGSDQAAAPTRRVTDLTGRTVDIPTAPQRIVVADANRILVSLVALGFEPVGATPNPTNPGGGFAPTLGAVGDRIARVGAPATPDLELISGLQPDLIIVNAFVDVPTETLERIAPVLLVDGQAYDGLFGVQNHLGDLLDRADRARATEQEFRALVADRRDGVGLDRQRVVALVVAADGYLAVAGSDDSATELIAMLGAQDGRPERVGGAPLDPASQEISAELLPEALALADVVIVLTYGGEDNEAATSALVDSELWQLVPAAAAGRFAVVDIQAASGNHGVDGLVQTIDSIAAQLT